MHQIPSGNLCRIEKHSVNTYCEIGYGFSVFLFQHGSLRVRARFICKSYKSVLFFDRNPNIARYPIALFYRQDRFIPKPQRDAERLHTVRD